MTLPKTKSCASSPLTHFLWCNFFLGAAREERAAVARLSGFHLLHLEIWQFIIVGMLEDQSGFNSRYFWSAGELVNGQFTQVT